MLVADFNQAASSATIGAGQAEKMSFSEDPAMFVAMIANLYSNQKLAFIRETICNAWDAHIASDKTNLPIYISVNKDYVLTFRDYGYGIPVDMMKATYNTLGGTTKRNSIGETGGFGLGCKSPLAYADSFVVTTMNQGTKAIYNMVKSAVELDGCPGLIPITQMKTEESGLEVRIQLKKEDFNEIDLYIKSVVFNGEIKAVYSRPISDRHGETIQEIELGTLGMPFDVGSYDLDEQWYYNYMGRGRIFIRYANVIYPALETPATEEALELLRKFISIVGCNRILIQAAPNTLALSPSRETLSSQQMTEDGITAMALAAVEKMENDIKTDIPRQLDIIESRIKSQYKRLDDSNRMLHDIMSYAEDGVVKRYMLSALWKSQREHWQKYWTNLAISVNLEAMQINPDLFNMNAVRAEAKKTNKAWSCAHYGKQMVSAINKHIAKKFVKLGINPANILLITNTRYYTPIGTATTICEDGYISNLGMMHLLTTKLVFVTTRKGRLDESLRNCPELKDGNKDTAAGYIIRVSSKKGSDTDMVSLLTKAGFTVINLADNHDWDSVATSRLNAARLRAAERVSKNNLAPKDTKSEYKPNQLVCVTCAIKDGKYFRHGARDSRWAYQVVVDRPTHYIHIDRVSLDGSIKYGNITNIPKEILETTVICRNKIEQNKAEKRGAVSLDKAMANQLITVFKSAKFHKYLESANSLAWNQYNLYSDDKTLFSLIGLKVPALTKMKENTLYNSVIEALYEIRGSEHRVARLFEVAEIDLPSNMTIAHRMRHFDAYANYKYAKDLTLLNEATGWRSEGNFLSQYSVPSMINMVKERPGIATIIKQLYIHYTTENIS